MVVQVSGDGVGEEEEEETNRQHPGRLQREQSASNHAASACHYKYKSGFSLFCVAIAIPA